MNNSKIKVGFVGAGWMGFVQMQRLMERDDVEIKALCELNTERGRDVLLKLGFSPDLLVSDYAAIAADPEIDVVWIVSPNSFHAPQAISAMKSGKHVFCEKPVATSFSDFCLEIQLEKENPELITFVDYILYFDQMEQKLRTMIGSGLFGQITQIQVNYRHPVNIAGDKVWKLNKNIMGDAISMGINHAISVMVFAMASQAKPVAVYATSMPAKVRGFDADPIWSILVQFDNGATGFCHGNIDNGNGYDAFHSIYGTRGALVFDSQQPKPNKVRYWSELETDVKWLFPLDPEQCSGLNMSHLAWPAGMTTPDSGNVVEHQTTACVTHFLECVKNRTKSLLSFSNTQVIAEIGWAAQMSAAKGVKINLPLDWNETNKFFKA